MPQKNHKCTKYPAATSDNHGKTARPRHSTFTPEIIHYDKSLITTILQNWCNDHRRMISKGYKIHYKWRKTQRLITHFLQTRWAKVSRPTWTKNRTFQRLFPRLSLRLVQMKLNKTRHGNASAKLKIFQHKVHIWSYEPLVLCLVSYPAHNSGQNEASLYYLQNYER